MMKKHCHFTPFGKLSRSLLLLFANFSTPKNNQFSAAVEPHVAHNNSNYVALFKKIHQNPELGFHEVETAAIVSKELQQYGYTVKSGIGKTGVVGKIKNGHGPVVMYRADMDALPLKELTNLPYKSTKVVQTEDGNRVPVAHACGHDAHVAWMLSAAKFMAEHQHLWKGTLLFICQPAEELIKGAEAMVKDGLYTRHGIPEPDYLYGMHTAPVATGMVLAATGTRMAGTDQIDVIFKGVGGHGSAPHMAKDPVIMATNAITQYQQIISRSMDPTHAAVLTVGAIQAGNGNNVIPQEAFVKINLRWFTEKDRKIMVHGIQKINESIAYANGIAEADYPKMIHKGWSYPLTNYEELTKVVRQGLLQYMNIKLWGEDQVPSVMGSEDFHHLVIHNKKQNYCYVNVGIAEPARFKKSFEERQELPFYNHNGNFEVDLDAIPIGTKTAIYGLLTIFEHYKA